MLYAAQITGAALITAVKSELMLAPMPPDSAFVRWLGSLEQLAWSEVIRTERRAAVTVTAGAVDLSAIVVPSDEDGVYARDVLDVFVGTKPLCHATPEMGYLSGTGVWYADGVRSLTVEGVAADSVTVVWRVRPKKRTGTVAQQTAAVALPEEFVELAASRLRAEAYRTANEDVLADKWTADYNARLEAFGAWCRRRTGGGV